MTITCQHSRTLTISGNAVVCLDCGKPFVALQEPEEDEEPQELEEWWDYGEPVGADH